MVSTGGRNAGTVIRWGEATGVGLAGLFSAGVSYIVLLIAARTLTPAENALFLTYWALLFSVFGVVTGVHPEAARATHDDSHGHVHARVVTVAVSSAAVVSIVIGLSALWWADRVLDPDHAWLVLVVVAAGAAFSGHLATTGVLVGRGRWHGLIVVNVFESSCRLACVIVAALVFGSLAGIAVASAVSAVAWVLLLVRRDVRQALGARGDVAVGRQLRNLAHSCTASASSAALVVGFPVLLRITTEPEEFLGAAGLLLAVTLTRGPLLVPLSAYQGVALKHFLRHKAEGAAALRPIAGLLFVVTALGAGAAGTVGPSLFGFLLGDRYSVSGALLASLTVGAGTLALVTLTGACSLAVGRHQAFAAGWVLATLVALLVLLLPVDLQLRTVLSLVAGPVCGALVHTWAVHGAERSARARGLAAQRSDA